MKAEQLICVVLAIWRDLLGGFFCFLAVDKSEPLKEKPQAERCVEHPPAQIF